MKHFSKASKNIQYANQLKLKFTSFFLRLQFILLNKMQNYI